MRNSLSRSPSSIFDVGIPVQRSTTLAICSGRTASSTITSLSSRFSASPSIFSSSGITPYDSSPAFARLPSRLAISRSARARSSSSFISRAPASLSRSACHCTVISDERSCKSARSFSSASRRSFEARSSSSFSASASICFCIISRSSASNSSGLLSTSMRRRLPASSIKSMALSGKKRSVI